MKDWKELGGRTVLISGLKQAFHDLALVIKPIKDGFREIFPRKTGKDLFASTVAFRKLMKELQPSPKTVDNLKRTFAGLFAILDIAKQIITGVAHGFKALFNSIGVGDGGFLGLTASIGDFIVSVDRALKQGKGLQTFLVGLGRIIAVPIRVIEEFAKVLGHFFGAIFSGGFSTGMNATAKATTAAGGAVAFFGSALAKMTELWNRFLDSLGRAKPIFQKIADAFGAFAKSLGPALNTAISNMNFEAILQVIRTGLLVGMFLMFKQFLGKGPFANQLQKIFGKSFSKLGGGIIKNVNLSLKSFTGTMTAMQSNLKAKTIKEISISIALLAASVLALSLVDPKRLNSAMTAVTIMLGELLGSMALFDKLIKAGIGVKLPIVASSMILLASAIDLLTIAVFALGHMSTSELKKGLGGIAVLLGGLTVVAGPLGKSAPGLIRAGVGISAIAVGLNIMAVAVSQFGNMDLRALEKGLAGIGISLGIIAVAMLAMPKTAIIQGPALIGIAIALNIIAHAVNQFGKLDWKTIGKGLAGVGGALVIIAGAMQLMPVSMPITAAGLLLVSLSLGKIAKAVESMGKMSIKQIAHGLLALGGALAILAAGLIVMSGTVGGAFALGIAASGIAVLTPALATLGKMSWHQIVKGLVTMAAAFAVLGVAGLALGPVVPALIGLGAALVLIGGGR